jgi:hypothetical protein
VVENQTAAVVVVVVVAAAATANRTRPRPRTETPSKVLTVKRRASASRRLTATATANQGQLPPLAKIAQSEPASQRTSEARGPSPGRPCTPPPAPSNKNDVTREAR